MLSVATLRTEDGGSLATLAVAAAHPTLLYRTVPLLSGDYPGEAMRRLGAGQGPALLLQGAEGDSRPFGTGEEAIQRQGAFIAQRVTETLATARRADDRLGFADVASANCIVIDDFKTGPTQLRLTEPNTTADTTQAGSMLGGWRRTWLYLGSNPYRHPALLTIGAEKYVPDHAA